MLMNIHSGTPGRSRDAKRRKILDAALAEFAARGYHGVSVPDVANAAGVGAGTLYRYFNDKETLVNEVYRDAKGRVLAAIFDGWSFDLARAPDEVFRDLWTRCVGFARAEPLVFQFLEMQDHLPYLDAQSRMVENMVLLPMLFAGQQIAAQVPVRDLPVEVLIAVVWGAVVGLFKAERLGNLRLDDDLLARVGEGCWDAIQRDDRRNA